MTLFHELGHGIHDLVARTTYARFHGTNTVRDFVEAPSQMLENWCWTPSQLKSLSNHYSYLTPAYKSAYHESAKGAAQPPRVIPDEVVDSLIKTKHVNDALFNLRQLHFGTFDMLIHEPSSHEAIEKLSVSEKYNSMRKDICKLDGPEVLGEGEDWGHGEATFGHLIGGYDAGYYGYLRYVVLVPVCMPDFQADRDQFPSLLHGHVLQSICKIANGRETREAVQAHGARKRGQPG